MWQRLPAGNRRRRAVDPHRVAGNFAAALDTPGARSFFLAAAPVRLGLAMTSISLVWLIQSSTGLFGVAGLIAGAFAVSEAAVGPLLARLIDRRGQTRTLPWFVGCHGIGVAVLIALTTIHGPQWTLLAAAVVAGSFIPQIGALTAARWSALLRGTALLSSAFTLESLSNAVSFLAGPTIAIIIATTVSPVAASAVAALLIVVGGVVFTSLRATAPDPADARDEPARQRDDPGRGGLANAGFGIVILVNFALGSFFGSMQLSVTAFAEAHDVAGSAGGLYSLLSVASLIGGAVYGRQHRKTTQPAQLALLLAFMGLACLPLVLIDSPLWLAAALLLPGLAIAPAIALSALLTEEHVDRSVLTQAFTWTNSASAAGLAIAASLTGALVDRYEPSVGFLVPILLTTVVAGVVWRARRRLSPDQLDATTTGPSTHRQDAHP